MTYTTSFAALGTTALVAVPRRDDLLRARGILVRRLDELDRACSRFRPDSELSRANARAGDWVHITPLLAEAVGAALAAARETDGLVDPTLGTQLRAAGYDRTYTLVQARDGWAFGGSAPAGGAWAKVELDGDRLRIPLGCELDLGATAKALAADGAARTIAAELDSEALVSLGGDIAVAGDREWSVRVAERHDAPLDGDGPCVALRAGGIATSSTTVRRWRTSRGDAHHVIDPRTGLPADGCWRTVTVAARTCLEANVAATAAIVLGDRAVGWLHSRGLASRLVDGDGAVVRICGWPTEADAA